MANLSDVQKAMRKGDKKRAAQLLQQTLKENPSADAWYFAGSIAKDPATSAKYMQKALQLDPNHKKAKRALRASKKGARQSQKQTKQQQSFIGRILLPVLAVLVFAGVGVYGVNVFTQTTGTAVEEGFQPEAGVGTANADAVADHFSSGAEVQPAEMTGGASAAWTVSLPGSGTRPATVYVYPSAEAMQSDESFLAAQMFENQALLTYHTVAMTYPNTLSGNTRDNLNELLRSLPVTEAQATSGSDAQ